MALVGTTSLGLTSKLGVAPVAFGAPVVADLAMRLGLMVSVAGVGATDGSAVGRAVDVVWVDGLVFKIDLGLFKIDLTVIIIQKNKKGENSPHATWNLIK